MDMDGPLDFESEDPLLSSSVVPKKRKKVIGLDDLLTDYYKDKQQLIEKESKQSKARKNYNSDDDDYGKEAVVSQVVDECQNKVNQLGGEEDISVWGVNVFGEQKSLPTLLFPELKDCNLLNAFLNNQLNSLVDLTVEKGVSFLEGLLINGWLSKLVSSTGHVEKSIASWTFNLILYSSREELRTSACDFWKSFMLPEDEVEQQSLKVDWLPNYAQLREALETYGYIFECSLNTGSSHTDSGCRGPPQNIRTWIKFVTVCCLTKSEKHIFTTSEVEQLTEVVICLFLERQLQGLTMLLCECLLSLINCFSDEEWEAACEKIAKSVVSRIPKDLNCLRAVECISGVDARSKYLRSTIAYQILLICFENQAKDEEEVLRLLTSITVKNKGCDLFKVYIYLVLVENWLVNSRSLEDKALLREMWGLFLRNCSCQIASTDLRSYASKVRNKASYILQASFDT